MWSGVDTPFFEVFTCEPKVFTAVENTAGNRYVGSGCTDLLLRCSPVNPRCSLQ